MILIQRYGGGSVSSINAIVALLQEQGLHQFYIHDDIRGWPGARGRDYWEKGITLSTIWPVLCEYNNNNNNNNNKNNSNTMIVILHVVAE